MTDPHAILELRGLSKSFGALKATDDVSLSLRIGEIHALIGPNGAGKSTLIGQIAGWTQPDSGEIVFDGRNITGDSPARRAKAGLGRSFQISTLALELSARRNVMVAVQAREGGSFQFWRSPRTDEALRTGAEAALRRAGLPGERHGTPVAELSHGERRLVELACALALAPKALLLDEPMAGLGPEGAERMTRLLAALAQDTPILLIEHDMDAVFALANRITVLVNGRVAASGAPDEIRRDPLVREAYLGDSGETLC